MLILSKSCSVQSNIQQSTKHDLVLLLCSGFVPAGTAECVLCLKILSRKGTLLGLVCDETTWPLECYDQTKTWMNQQFDLSEETETQQCCAVSGKLPDQVTCREILVFLMCKLSAQFPLWKRLLATNTCILFFLEEVIAVKNNISKMKQCINIFQ